MSSNLGNWIYWYLLVVGDIAAVNLIPKAVTLDVVALNLTLDLDLSTLLDSLDNLSRGSWSSSATDVFLCWVGLFGRGSEDRNGEERKNCEVLHFCKSVSKVCRE